MRIPPAVAQQIGKMYEAAHVNDAAAKVLTESTTLLTSARSHAASDRTSDAIADATTAVELLASVTGADAKIVDATTRGWAATAATAATDAIALLEQQDSDAAQSELQHAAIAADTGVLSAQDNAALWRFSADELAKEHL